MERRSTRRQLLALCGTTATALSGCSMLSDIGLGPSADSDDSEPTDWPMVGNGPTHTGYAPNTSLATGALSVQWSVDLGTLPYSSPVVADSLVFVASGAFGIGAFDRSGTNQWLQPSIGHYVSSPAVNTTSMTLFVGEDSRNSPKGGAFVRALDATTGQEQWRTQLDGADTEVFSPTVTNDAVYIRTDTGLVVLNAVDGSVRWKKASSATMPLYLQNIVEDISPAVTDDLVFDPEPDGLRAIDPLDQSVVWKKQTGKVRAAPAVDGSTVYFSDASPTGEATPDGQRPWGVYALDAATGTEHWRSGNPSWTSPAVADGQVYVTHRFAVTALNAADGRQNWTTGSLGLHGDIYSSIAVGDGVLVAGSIGYGLAVLDADGGDWFSNNPIRWHTGPGTHCSHTIANNCVYACLWPTPSQHGGLYVYQ